MRDVPGQQAARAERGRRAARSSRRKRVALVRARLDAARSRDHTGAAPRSDAAACRSMLYRPGKEPLLLPEVLQRSTMREALLALTPDHGAASTAALWRYFYQSTGDHNATIARFTSGSSLTMLFAAGAAVAVVSGAAAPRFTITDSVRQGGAARRLQGQVCRARMDQSRMSVRAQALTERQHAGAAEGMGAPATSSGSRSIRPMRSQFGIQDAAADERLDEGPGRRAFGHARSTSTSDDRTCVRREDDAPHVRRRSCRQSHLRRGDRRQAIHESGRCEDREQLRPRCAHQKRCRARPVTVGNTTPYGCSVKY